MAGLLVTLLLSQTAPTLDKDETLGLAGQYVRAESWALKGMVLLSLGPKWHKAGAPWVAKALRDKDRRVRPFAVEALIRTDPDLLRRVATAEVLDALVFVQAKSANKYFGERARKVLGRIAPAAGATNKTSWKRWWEQHAEVYEPLRWTEPEGRPKSGRKTVAANFLKRAFDLQAAGLEVAICIDSTGSMQDTIDLARDSVMDTVTVLGAVAQKFRVGLVTYRDDDDLPGGAKVLAKLTSNARSVRSLLGRLVAAGGGDDPERLERGLELALDRNMGWKRPTNKVVIIVGDAPPKDMRKAQNLARAAHQWPFAKSPTTQSKPNTRPFIISAIAVGKTIAPTFEKITKVGGGSTSVLSTRRLPKSVRRVTQVVKHILTLAFGERWKDQVGAFIRVYDKYRNGKYLR